MVHLPEALGLMSRAIREYTSMAEREKAMESGFASLFARLGMSFPGYGDTNARWRAAQSVPERYRGKDGFAGTILAILDDIEAVFGPDAVNAPGLAERATRGDIAAGRAEGRVTRRIDGMEYMADAVVRRGSCDKSRFCKPVVLEAALGEASDKHGAIYVFTRESLKRLLSKQLDADVEF